MTKMRQRKDTPAVDLNAAIDEDGPYLLQDGLDEACKMGCGDPACNLRPEEHWGMGIEPRCHKTNEITAFYDSRTKMLYLRCSVCDEEIVRVKVAGA